MKKIRLYFNLLYYITLFFGYTKILRKKKTRDRVRTSYDKNPYKKFLQSKSWTESKSLQEFVSISYYSNLVGNNISTNFLFDGKLYKGKTFEVSKHFMNHKVNTFKKIVSDEDVIVEVGCGVGTQLFSLRANGINNKMEGYDISQNAIKACQQINHHFNCDIKFGVLDLTEDFNSIVSLKNKTVYSSHCLEQLKHYTDKIIYNLIKAKPKQVLHFEPIKELYGSSFRDIVSRMYIYTVDFQSNLLVTLKKI